MAKLAHVIAASNAAIQSVLPLPLELCAGATRPPLAPLISAYRHFHDPPYASIMPCHDTESKRKTLGAYHAMTGNVNIPRKVT
jgi:hypothetical protein